MPYLKFFRKYLLQHKWAIQAQIGTKSKQFSVSVSALRIFLNLFVLIKNNEYKKIILLKFPKKSSIWGKCTIWAGFDPNLCNLGISGSTLRTFLKVCWSMSWTLNFLILGSTEGVNEVSFFDILKGSVTHMGKLVQ